MTPVDIYADDAPSYAGGPTFCRVPLARVSELTPGQVAVLGAPVDEAVTVRPGARFGPRAIRLADDTGGPPGERRHVSAGVHPFATLDVVDVGDVGVVPGDPEGNLRRIEVAARAVAAAGATPIVLGGDHSIARATIGGAVAGSGRVPYIVQFDAHADTAKVGPRRPVWSHGSPIRRLVDEGVVDGDRVQQIGLRGYFPSEEDFAWADDRGVRHWSARDVHRLGMQVVLASVLDAVPEGEDLWVSFDIDVVDPAFAPGTGTPEPGGLTSWQALEAVWTLAATRRLLGFEIVEVAPPYDVEEITAMLAHRLVVEALSAMAVRLEADTRSRE
jgi:agmatinase